MAKLLIASPSQRRLVRLADLVSAPLSWLPQARTAAPVTKVLLLRLERIGDLLMTLEAIADATSAWPDAAIDLAVGSWNQDLARMIPGVRTIHVADVPWLSRGERETSWRQLVEASGRWRRERYDVVVNFEPDIRSNLLAWLTDAPVRVGYDSSGGGAFLTNRSTYDTGAHVAVNARRLIETVSGTRAAASVSNTPRLIVSADAMERARARMGSAPRPWIGVHASGGRESKQWHLDRFSHVARTLATATGGTIFLTGGQADLQLVEQVASSLSDIRHVSLAGWGALPELAAVATALDLLVTGDTGPMHVAGAVGTPVVALFGPSDPLRYGPRSPAERIVRVQLPCSPCGQVRLPPERCRGHVPDCMDGITVDAVVGHALALLRQRADERGGVPA
jgi:ADP-heptose:LPS heptosyltransferase